MKRILDIKHSTELLRELLEKYGFKCTEVSPGEGGIFYTENGKKKIFSENIFVKRLEKYEPTIKGQSGLVSMSTLILDAAQSDEYETGLSEFATDCVNSIIYSSEPKVVEISTLRENDEFEIAPDNNLTAA